MKRKLTWAFILLTLILMVACLFLYSHATEYAARTLVPFYPLVLFLRPAFYLCFGISLTLLAFKELSVKLFREIFLFTGIVLVFIYLLMCICLITGVGLGILTQVFLVILQYVQLFFLPGLFIGVGLNHTPGAA